MQVHISGHHVETGAAFQQYINEKIKNIVEKYFQNAVRADVRLSKQTSMYTTHIIVNEGTHTGITIKSDGIDPEPYRSFDCALHKLESQLRKYKDKIKRHRKTPLKDAINMMKYVIEPFAEASDLLSEVNEKSDDIIIEGKPKVVEEKEVSLEKMSVSDAIMQMDLQNLPAYLFINGDTDKVNLVYYRKDGNISWLDTKVTAKQ